MRPTLPETIEQFRAFVQALSKRKDILVTQKRLGKPGAPTMVHRYRRQNPLPSQEELDRWGQTPQEALLNSYAIPQQLLDFLELMNGVDLEWQFVGSVDGGCLHIPALPYPLNWSRAFQTDEENYTRFGEGRPSMCLDRIQPEYGTWLVADSASVADQNQARLVFAFMNDEGKEVAASIAEYLQKGMAVGFVNAWPSRDAATDDTIRRFLAPPVVPGKIQVGGRVHSLFFQEGCRGEVLRLARVAPGAAMLHLRFLKQLTFALVRLDLGPTLWLPTEHLKAVAAAPDLYEQTRADPWHLVRLGEAAGWNAALREMALLWVTDSSYYRERNGYVGRAGHRVVAGLLATLPLGDALALTTRLMQGCGQARAELLEPRTGFNGEPYYKVPLFQLSPAEQKRAFGTAVAREAKGVFYWEAVPETLLSGFNTRLLYADPAERAALDPAALDALRAAYPVEPDEKYRDFARLLRHVAAGHYKELELRTTEPTPELPEPFPVADGIMH